MAFNQHWLCNYSANVCTDGKYITRMKFHANLFDFTSNVLHIFSGWTANLRSLWECMWPQNLDNHLFNQIISQSFTDIDLSTRTTEELLYTAISALQAFVQDNFVGPSLKDEEGYNDLSCHAMIQTIGIASVRNYLMSDGEEINTNVSHPELLAVAKYILLHLQSNFETVNDLVEKFICQQWLLRYYGVHQLVIDDDTDSLFSGIDKTSESLVEILNNVENIDKDSKVICLLEIAEWLLHYKRIGSAKEKLQMAQQLLDVNITIEGKLGVRTKYQRKPLPQLMLRVDSPNGDCIEVPPIESPIAPVKLPALLQLDDDVRLEKIQFVNDEDNIITRTKGIVQTLILST